MYPSWGNYGGSQQSQNYGTGNNTGGAAGYGGSSGGSIFSSLQEQHLQQMQQLQMLHQKQLQSVLHHGPPPSGAYNSGPSAAYSGSNVTWQSSESGVGPSPYYTQNNCPNMTIRGPLAQPQDTQPPPPSQPHPSEAKPEPPPPEPPSVKTSKPPENNAPKFKEDVPKHPASGNDKPMSLQNQQQQWYKQHLHNLQKMKQEKSRQNQKDGEASTQLHQSSELTKNTPPPPPPIEEPPAPPPPPPPSEPETPQDPEQAVRLQQLQVAAAQWQHVQQQRAGLQYQALMQQHEKLQKILEQYQKLIQQPPNLQTMSAEMQLRHYKTQQQQFGPLYQDWDRTFILWFEQFQSYPHKDQLQDYENQWKQWQQQMNATNAHIQERMATLTAMVPNASTQYGGGTVGQCKPEHEQLNQKSVNQGSKDYALNEEGGPRCKQLQKGSEESYNKAEKSTDGPSQLDRPSRFDGPSRFGDPLQHFEGASRFDSPRQRFEVPRQRFDTPRQRFDGPKRFDAPRQRFDGPQRFDASLQRFDGPQRFDCPGPRFDGPQRFDGSGQRFHSPGQRLDGPPKMDQPLQRFDGPQHFDGPRQRFDSSSRFDQPSRGSQPQSCTQPIQPPLRPPGPLVRPPVPQQQKQQSLHPKTGPVAKLPDKDQKTEELKGNVSVSNDMTNDNMVGKMGFFIQNDPIPQTCKNDTSDNEKSKSADGKPPDSKAPGQPDLAPKAVVQSPLKRDELATSNPALQKNQPSVTSQDSQSSKQSPAKTIPLGPVVGRGRGQPPMPGRGGGRGRGQKEQRELSGPNSASFGGDMDDQSYDYEQSKAELTLPEEQDEHHWQDSSYTEFQESSEPTNEDLWMPDEHFYPPEEEYYEDPTGSCMGRGGYPMMRGRPPMPMGRGVPPRGRGTPPMGRGHPPVMRGGPLMGRGVHPVARGGPPMGRGYMLRGGLAMARAGPPRGRGGPPIGRGGPPMGRGGPPMGRGGPTMGRGGHPVGSAQSIEGHWEDPELAEYQPEVDQYWEEWGPPTRGMRGMRPPFPPGRGRLPRGHPLFTRGRPPHPAHRPMGPEHYDVDPELDSMYHDPHGRPMHPEAGRGRGAPQPPREMIEHGEEWYNDETDPAYGRGPPLAPREIMEQDETRRQPIDRGITRDKWPPGPIIEYEQSLKEGFVADYGHGEREYRRGPDYPRDDYESHWDREAPPPERRYTPRVPPPRTESYRDDPWANERDRDYQYSHEDRDRPRGELRAREFRDEPHYRLEDPSYSVSRSRLSPLPERHYPDYEHRPSYQDNREGSLDRSGPVESVSNLSETSVESATQGGAGSVLALSQRQHEIILKAAQELKLIRELQETKAPSIEPEPAPVARDILPELPAGLLGLEIPQDIKNVLKGIASQSATKEPLHADSNPVTNYQLSLQAPIIPKTVDYAHGHEPGATVEKISYGERIILRPDPLPPERGYEKGTEPLGLRDPYNRDYYDRRDPYLERREYSREREYREKLPDRDRYERERYSSRDDRSVISRSGYRERERERDVRERDHSGSRDREHYGRPDYDREPYRQSSLDRERYCRGPSPPLDRRSYEDRAPPAPALPPPSRHEKKPEMKNIDDILKMPGRLTRPDRIVIIMRGLPGSGKSHVAKLIRDKEVHCGGAPPRVIVLDDYFMTEVEKVEKDPDTGRRVKTKVLEYEYEPEMEETYRSSMLKTFKKTLDDGFFPFIILDTVNDRVRHFDQFWSAAKTKGFEVYLAEITADVQTCTKRNVHGRTHKDITKMANNWEPSPGHMVCLDVRSILQDAAIEEVEMEDFNPDDEVTELKKEEEDEGDQGYLPKSKWEMDTSEAKLDKLDGLNISGKRKREGLEDFLQLPDDYATRMSQPGKKRVRWADLEEQKNADLKRAIGFVVGQTDWERITDDSGQLAQRALNRTKYF